MECVKHCPLCYENVVVTGKCISKKITCKNNHVWYNIYR